MSLTRKVDISRPTRKEYTDESSKYICNGSVEWLMEHGKIRECVFHKGAVGDRYTLYMFSKRTKNVVDIHTVYNTYAYDTASGTHVGSINKNYVLTLLKGGNAWYESAGYTLRQLMRQRIAPRAHRTYTIKYCRSAYFAKLYDGTEFTPWLGMKINLKTGELVNRPSKRAKAEYNKAKETDKTQRKRNYIANRENRKALARYKAAGGDTELARGWNVDEAKIAINLAQMDWSKVPKEDVFRHRNATLRSNIIEHYGMTAIIADLEHEVIDEETVDGRPYRLLNVSIPDFSDASPGFDGTYKGLYLEMLNPSTGESHFEGVPNARDEDNRFGDLLPKATVKEALKWRDGDANVRGNNSWGSSSDNIDYIEPIVLT